jgi:hypothetical membrane protein
VFVPYGKGFYGMLAAVIFTFVFISSIMQFPGYSPFLNYLSDLGSAGNPLLFNFGLAACGLVGIAFGYEISRHFKIKLIFFLFSIESIALIFIGVFNDRFGMFHLASAAVFFAAGAATMIVFAAKTEGTLRYYSILSAALALGFGVVNTTFVEHISVFAIVLWVFVIGASIYKSGQKI